MELNAEIIQEKKLVKINPETAKQFQIEELNLTVVRFGLAVAEARIVLSDNIDKNSIQISEDLLEKNKVPITNDYHIMIKSKEIIIGPFIGIYIVKDNRPVKWRYERLHSFVKDFSNVNGLICAFWDKDIDFDKMQINAYCYDHSNAVWSKQLVPFPTVIHRNGGISYSLRDKFRGIYGNNFFNYNEMNKWVEMTALSQKKDVRQYVPETKLCENEVTFRDFLNKFNDIYFKPIRGRQGRNIHRICKLKNGKYKLTINSRKSYKEKKLESIDHLVDLLNKEINSSTFILQQTIDLEVKNRVIDFRIRYEKTEKNDWELSIFAARVSGAGGVVSNRSAGGNVLTPEEAMKKYYDYSSRKIEDAKKRLIEAGEKLVRAINRSNVELGKCAVDLGLDIHGEVWHIESNVITPNDLTTWSFEKYEGMDRIGVLNTSYAKQLTGFNNIDEVISFGEKEVNTIYSKKDFNFNLRITGRLKATRFLEDIISFMKEHCVDIKKIEEKNTYILFKVKSKENNLVKTLNELRSIDQSNVIKAILFERAIKKRRRKSTKTAQKLIEENKQLSLELQRVKKEIDKIQKSTSWKLTKPLRMLGKIVKRSK